MRVVQVLFESEVHPSVHPSIHQEERRGDGSQPNSSPLLRKVAL